MITENLFRRIVLVGVLLGVVNLAFGSDADNQRPSLREVRRLAIKNATNRASLDIKNGGTSDSKSISGEVGFDLPTAAPNGFNQEEMAAYFSAFVEQYMKEVARSGEPLAGPIPRYGPREKLVNAQTYLDSQINPSRIGDFFIDDTDWFPTLLRDKAGKWYWLVSVSVLYKDKSKKEVIEEADLWIRNQKCEEILFDSSTISPTDGSKPPPYVSSRAISVERPDY
jgi:hypothetical protein